MCIMSASKDKILRKQQIEAGTDKRSIAAAEEAKKRRKSNIQYAVIGTLDGKCYRGVCNVGVKPTVGGTIPCVETWLEGVEQPLYGRELTVEFYRFLRPERKFDSLSALKDEVDRNRSAAVEYFSGRQDILI